MIEVGAFEAKTHFSRLLNEASRGETIVIARHGRRIARVAPIEGSRRDDRRQAVFEIKERRRGQTPGGLLLREPIAEGRR